MAEYIEREALFRSIADDVAPFNVAMVFRHIHNAPAADVAPVRHGRWEVIEGMIENAVCSNCGRHFQSYYEAYHYCPNCGAKMDGETEGNDG